LKQPYLAEFSRCHTVFCDFDGPIVDVSDRYYATYCQGLADVQALYQHQGEVLPLHILTKHQFWQMKQERTPDPEIAMRSGLQDKQIDLFLQQVMQRVHQADLLHHDCLQPGVQRALSQLHRQRVQLVLVTLRRRSQALQLLQHYGVDHYFNRVYGTHDDDAAYLNQSEQKTQLLSEAVSDAGLARSPHNRAHMPLPAWMIGDTEADILAGQALGIPTIALTCGIRSQSYLQRFTPSFIQPDLATAIASLFKPHQVAA
jgi:phosphoglycolate phosphatase